MQLEELNELIENKVIRLKVRELVAASGLKQKEFAVKVGLREATLSLMINNKYERIQLDHLLRLMIYLNTTNFNDIFEIVDK